MSIALVVSDGAVASSTSPSMDTTGATLLVIIAHYYTAPGAYSFSDSKGNTWHQRTIYGPGGTAHIVLAYSYDKGGSALVVGAGHTFTIASASYQSITVSAWSGTLGGASDPYYAENGGADGGSSPQQPGSVTPFAAGDLIITGCGEGNSYTYAPTITAGWTISKAVYDGSNTGGGHAYLISPDGAAVNPTWTWTSSTDLIANIATFKQGEIVPPIENAPEKLRVVSGARWR